MPETEQEREEREQREQDARDYAEAEARRREESKRDDVNG